MDPFTIAGLAATGVSALGKLFGRSDEEERQARFADYLQMVRGLRQEAQRRALKQTSGMISQATAGAGRRALQAGRAGDIEAYVAPAQANAVRAAGRVVDAAVAPYDSAQIAGARDFYNRPISRGGLTGFLEEVGPPLAQYGMGREGLNAQSQYLPGYTPNLTSIPEIDANVSNDVNLIRRRRNTLSLSGGGNY